MTGSCSARARDPAQLGVRCGLPESRNLSACLLNSGRGFLGLGEGRRVGGGERRSAVGQRWSGRSEGEKKRKWIERKQMRADA